MKIRKALGTFIIITILLLALTPTVNGDLTGEVSPSSVAKGGSFVVSGTVTDSDQVDIVIIHPKGKTGTGIRGGSGITTYTLSDVGRSFSKKIEVNDDADTGNYFVVAVSPGRDGVYGIREDSLRNIIEGIGATKIQDQIFAILQDRTVDQAGSDDCMWVSSLRVGSPRIRLNPVEDVVIGEELGVTGTTNIEEGTTIVIIAEGPIGLAPEITSVKDGTFSATFDTSDASVGTYTITADDGDGHTDETTVDILPVPPPTPTPAPTRLATPKPKPSSGTVNLEVIAPNGNMVPGFTLYVDGSKEGTEGGDGKWKISDLAIGNHEIKVYKSDYGYISKSIKIAYDGDVEDVTLKFGLVTPTAIPTAIPTPIPIPPQQENFDGGFLLTLYWLISGIIIGIFGVKRYRANTFEEYFTVFSSIPFVFGIFCCIYYVIGWGAGWWGAFSVGVAAILGIIWASIVVLIYLGGESIESCVAGLGFPLWVVGIIRYIISFVEVFECSWVLGIITAIIPLFVYFILQKLSGMPLPEPRIIETRRPPSDRIPHGIPPSRARLSTISRSKGPSIKLGSESTMEYCPVCMTAESDIPQIYRCRSCGKLYCRECAQTINTCIHCGRPLT